MTLKGNVTRLPCGQGAAEPAIGATVAIQREDMTVKTAETDENGEYVIDGLIEGEYLARISQERYVGTTRVLLAVRRNDDLRRDCS